MQFINPLNNKIQTCNINIYNEHKIKKPELNNLLLYLYNNKRLQYNLPLSLRILRNISYIECCNLLKSSDIEFINTTENKDTYKDINCLDLSVNILKQLAKDNFIQINNSKYKLCNNLISLNYIFKDNNNITNPMNKNTILNNTNINLIDKTFVNNINDYIKNKNNTIENTIETDYNLPLSILILKFGLNIYTHNQNYVYIPSTYIKNITINIIDNIINILLDNNITYILNYKQLFISENSIVKLHAKFKLDYNNILTYLNILYSNINVIIPNRNNILFWTKNNCNNYANCSINDENILFLDNKICVKNKYTNDYININNLIKLNDNNCYDLNDIKNLIKFDDNSLNLSELEKNYITSI